MPYSQHPLSRFAGLCEIKPNSEYPHGTLYCVRCAVQRSLVWAAILKFGFVRWFHMDWFLPAFLSAVFPECRSCPGISPQRFVLFGTLMSWRYFAGEHIPFGRSCTFQATESCDKYILAKKHDHSRISKRMEKALKKQQFPRLWTSCVIIKEIERWGGLAWIRP